MRMTRAELLDALCDGDEDERDLLKHKRTTTLRRMLIDLIEDGVGDLFPNGRDFDREDEDFI